MANSFVQYTGNGSTTAFSITFDFIDASHLACTVAGSSTSFVLSSGNTVATLATAPANGAAIEFRRTTSQTSRLTDYVAGSVLKETDLDTDSKQGFFMGQEAIDNAANTIQQDSSDFNWNANNKKIKNVTDPTAAQHAATKNYVDTGANSQVVSATTQATNAANSATAAATSATNASNSASTASTQATNSSNSASTSTTKASEASTSATAAASSASTASAQGSIATTKASEASTSASNASNSASTSSTQATNSANSATAAANSATAAANSADSFDDTYLGAKSSDPTVDNDGDALSAGDLYFNTGSNQLKYYTGSTWNGLGLGLNNVSEDTTPQLGGNLDLLAKEINTSTTDGNIIVAPNGEGMLEVKGNDNGGTIKLNCESNSHGVKIKSPPHSAAQDYTLTLPSSITNNYYLKTDANGNLSFAAVPVETKPTVANVSQTIAPSSATTINITGSNFVTVPIVEFIKTDGSVTRPNTVSFTNATTLSVNVTLASGAYHLRIENPDGNSGRSTNNIITASTAPSFSSSAGSLGSVGAAASVSIDVDGSSDSTVAFSETTSVLTSNANTPAATMNLSLNSSTGLITGTAPSPSSSTTYNFTLRLTDAESQTVDRAFSITVEVGMANSMAFN